MNLNVTQLTGGNSLNVNVEMTNTCPLCHRDIATEQTVFHAASYENWLEILLRCPSTRCRHAFIAYFRRTPAPQNPNHFAYERSLPANPIPAAFEDTITALSPDFVRIFGQATAAETNGLDDVAGPGFRKALEYLLKDYAISLYPHDAETIKKSQLGAVIGKYFTEQRMSVVCSRAAWLGNDETHYEKRWVGKDLTDLKKLIMASVHFIAMERLAAEPPTDMPDPGAAKPATATP